jgi:hypothetical protein
MTKIKLLPYKTISLEKEKLVTNAVVSFFLTTKDNIIARLSPKWGIN